MLDLFSGIGGFSLAASWVWGNDLEIAGFCEIDKYCEKVLNKNFPGVPVYKDITQLDGTQFKNIDLITGGFPCQDISVAGKGKGLFNEETGTYFIIEHWESFEKYQTYLDWRLNDDPSRIAQELSKYLVGGSNGLVPHTNNIGYKFY